MRAADALRQLRERVMSPYAWIAVATFGGVSVLLTAFVERLAPTQSLYVHIMSSVGKLIGAIGYGFLSPLPWQWTGDDREHCSPLRGCLQGMAFSGALYGLTGALDLALAPRFSPQGRTSLFWTISPAAYLIQIPLMAAVGAFIARGEMRDRERLRAQADLEEAKWILLREQMSPHVLFNTLNGLAELARRDPAATERALLDLSDLFERMLRYRDLTRVTLGEERNLLERYLAIQALRLGERLRVEWDWDSAMEALPIPPILVQPLVENAIKHGIARVPAGGTLRIALHHEAGRIRLDIANTGEPPPAPRPGATGLANLKERLHLAYGGRAAFRLEHRGGWTHAILDLPEEPWN